MFPHIRDLKIDHNSNYLASFWLCLYGPVMFVIEGTFMSVLIPLFNALVMLVGAVGHLLIGVVSGVFRVLTTAAKLFAYGLMGYLRVKSELERETERMALESQQMLVKTQVEQQNAWIKESLSSGSKDPQA